MSSNDPDTDSRASGVSTDARTWRYLFNRAGDLVASRDPRGCGQNFFYDLGGRLLGEQYVGCAEAQTSASELPTEVVLDDAVAQDARTGARTVDVRYFYDSYPCWVTSGGCAEHETLVPPLPGGAALRGRATGVADRAQRAAVSYDRRGNAVWTARQVALIPTALGLTADVGTIGGIDFPFVTETPPSVPGTVGYDWQHTYIRTATFDHAGRPTGMALPRDPDWNAGSASTAAAPPVTGHLEYDDRGLPSSASLAVGDDPAIPVVTAIHYLRDGLVDRVVYGAAVVTSLMEYDERRRPVRMSASRPATGTSGLRAITEIADQQLVWDAASNLTFIRDLRDPSQWPVGHRPQSVEIHHDSLYRVVSALFDYSEPGDAGSTNLSSDDATDWRDSAGHGGTRSSMGSGPNGVDPMRPDPAPMVTTAPPERVQALVWSWDWLGNMNEWSDDAQQFYERSIGDIANGQDVGERPSALYLAASIDPADPSRSGWVELDYGNGGNVTAVTVHGQCSGGSDIGGSDIEARRAHLRAAVSCENEQHYQYRWDELNRISEARRFDRAGGSASAWTFEARQRYRYDGANVRVIKQSFDTGSADVDSTDNRVALYVYAGDFERRGLELDGSMMTYAPVVDVVASTETQYLVAGARMVWDHDASPEIGTDLDRNRRLTIPVGDLLHTTAASVDLLSGELLEVSTYYPNGARETLLVDEAAEGDELPLVPLEPLGFTAKESDEDVGLVYFGERYLLSRVGRWASPDPLYISGGPDNLQINAFHYVAGNLLQSRDPLGLQCEGVSDCDDSVDEAPPPPDASRGESSSFEVLSAPPTLGPDVWVPSALRNALENGEWGLATEEGEDGGETRSLYYRTQTGDGSWGAWTRFDPADFDLGPGGESFMSAGPDETGNAIIGMAGEAGAATVAIASTLLRAAIARAAITIPTRAGVYRIVGGAAARVASAHIDAGLSAGIYFVRHGSGLVTRVEMGAGGQLLSAEARLTRAAIGRGTDATAAARALRDETGVAGDEAGHLIARVLGGSGGPRFLNIVALARRLNGQVLSVFESGTAGLVRRGATLTYRFEADYAAGSLRPLAVRLTAMGTAADGSAINVTTGWMLNL